MQYQMDSMFPNCDEYITHAANTDIPYNDFYDIDSAMFDDLMRTDEQQRTYQTDDFLHPFLTPPTIQHTPHTTSPLPLKENTHNHPPNNEDATSFSGSTDFANLTNANLINHTEACMLQYQQNQHAQDARHALDAKHAQDARYVQDVQDARDAHDAHYVQDAQDARYAAYSRFDNGGLHVGGYDIGCKSRGGGRNFGGENCPRVCSRQSSDLSGGSSCDQVGVGSQGGSKQQPLQVMFIPTESLLQLNNVKVLNVGHNPMMLFKQGGQGSQQSQACYGPRVCSKEERQKKLQRYREKKKLRKFVPSQIRYPLRKLNADKRPRIKGRFVKQRNLSQSPETTTTSDSLPSCDLPDIMTLQPEDILLPKEQDCDFELSI